MGVAPGLTRSDCWKAFPLQQMGYQTGQAITVVHLTTGAVPALLAMGAVSSSCH